MWNRLNHTSIQYCECMNTIRGRFTVCSSARVARGSGGLLSVEHHTSEISHNFLVFDHLRNISVIFVFFVSNYLVFCNRFIYSKGIDFRSKTCYNTTVK
jgi:hypothetical protein